QDIGPALREFEAVYNASWKKPEGKPAFIAKFSQQATLNDWTRIGILYVNSVPCAVQLWYVAAGVGSIFKLAHDEKFKAYSVGSILTFEMLRHAIDEDGVSKIDFLIGGDGYKKDWGFKMQERWGLAIFNKTLRGRMLAFRHIFLPRVKNRVLKFISLNR
ncbi:MAG: GNAT family N-acetyltransferase, partial [Pseudomonadales bacterium]|nr:GNAT family N-acetyltransferase [Pseudomonadales bacterium]